MLSSSEKLLELINCGDIKAYTIVYVDKNGRVVANESVRGSTQQLEIVLPSGRILIIVPHHDRLLFDTKYATD